MTTSKKSGKVATSGFKIRKISAEKSIAGSDLSQARKIEREMVEGAFREATKRTGTFASKYAK